MTDHEQHDGFYVYWAALMERSVPNTGVNSLINVGMIGAVNGYTRISVPYMRTDWARSLICRAFLDQSQTVNDLLIMLDCDHDHPRDILPMLAAHPPEYGVVGALAFRRGPPYEPMMFVKDSAGRLRSPAEWEKGVYEVDVVGGAAFAIRRWVFDELDAHGHTWPYFRFAYPPECGFNKSEDVFFCDSCHDAGITVRCNTSIVTPHLGEILIDDKLWFEQNVHRVGLDDYDSAMTPGGVSTSVPQIRTRLEDL